MEGFTCLLYAVYRGNLVILTQNLVKLFLTLHANPYISTSLGLGPMHIAAQGDRLEMLAFFTQKGFDTQSLDARGSTPMHWAAYLGC